MNKALRPSGWLFSLYLLPGLVIYSFVVLIPILAALGFSFYYWTGGPKMRFIGLQNYVELVRDSVFWHSFWNNVLMTAYGLIGGVAIAFLFALLILSKRVKFRGLHRTVSFFPHTLAPVIVAFIWGLMYNYDQGLINALLRGIGLERMALSWLDLTGSIVLVISVPLFWQNIGFFTIIMLAGISSINREVLEVAEIDGATGAKKTWYIIMPLVKSTLIVAVLLCISMNMRGFEHVYALTGGGPGDASSVMALYAYKSSFLAYKYGYASAVSIAIMILTLVIIFLSRFLLQFNWRKRGG
ncbi:MAG: transporter permease [Paenibacillus sp.]|jgi:raffinose/stachyose/melibiose transport system permease protein|nr:transporter permease [Paenibacillus sp.]